MTLLIAGMLLFGVTHMVSRWRSLRASAIERLGAAGYKGVYSLVALGALALIVIGYKSAEFTPLYDPLEKSRAIAHAAMPFAFILAAGANMRSNLKRMVGHPLSLSVILWSAAHLSANGDMAAVILFGGFGLYAAINLVLSLADGPTPPPPPQPRHRDLILIVAGLTGYAVVMMAHEYLFGVAVVG